MSSGAIPGLSVSAEVAARNVALAARHQRTQRRLPPVSPSIQTFAKEHEIYIHNVGPWDHNVMLGSWGKYSIPACPSDKPYVSGDPIPGFYHEPIPVNESNFQLEAIEGSYVADQILGVGKNLAWNTSLVKLGVFQSHNKVPTDAELEAARELLHAEFMRLFEEAETAYAQGPKEFQQVVGDGVKHKLAARELRRGDASWMQNASVGKRKSCPNCGTYAEQQVVSCANCAYVFDLEAFRAMEERMVGSARRGPGRPPNPRPQG